MASEDNKEKDHKSLRSRTRIIIISVLSIVLLFFVGFIVLSVISNQGNRFDTVHPIRYNYENDPYHKLLGDSNQRKGVSVKVFDGYTIKDVEVKKDGSFKLPYTKAYVAFSRTVIVTKDGCLPDIKNIRVDGHDSIQFGPLKPLKNKDEGVLVGATYTTTIGGSRATYREGISGYKADIQITALNKNSEYKFATNKDGIFIQQLPEGEYSLEGVYVKPDTKVKILSSKTTVYNISLGEHDVRKHLKKPVYVYELDRYHKLLGDADQRKDVSVKVFDGYTIKDVEVKKDGSFRLPPTLAYGVFSRTVIVKKDGYLPDIKNAQVGGFDSVQFGPLNPLKSKNEGVLVGVYYSAVKGDSIRYYSEGIGSYKADIQITARNETSEYKFAGNKDGIFIQQLPEGEYSLEGSFIEPGTKVRILSNKTTIRNISVGIYDTRTYNMNTGE